MCWMCWGCTGAAALHSWEHFAGGLRLLTPSSLPCGEQGQKMAKNGVFLGGGGICCRYQIQKTFAAITMCLLQLQPYPVSPSCQEMPLRFGRGTEEALKCHALCSWPLESLLCPALWWQKSTDSSEIPPHLHWPKFTPKANFPFSMVQSSITFLLLYSNFLFSITQKFCWLLWKKH